MRILIGRDWPAYSYRHTAHNHHTQHLIYCTPMYPAHPGTSMVLDPGHPRQSRTHTPACCTPRNTLMQAKMNTATRCFRIRGLSVYRQSMPTNSFDRGVVADLLLRPKWSYRYTRPLLKVYASLAHNVTLSVRTILWGVSS